MGASHICKCSFPPLFSPNYAFMLWHWYQVQITSLLKYFAQFPPMPSSFLTSPLNLIALFRTLNIKKQSVYTMMSVLTLGLVSTLRANMSSCLSFSPKHQDSPWCRVVLNSCLLSWCISILGMCALVVPLPFFKELHLTFGFKVRWRCHGVATGILIKLLLRQFWLIKKKFKVFSLNYFLLYFLLLLFKDTAIIISSSKAEILESYLISVSVTPYICLSGSINFFLKNAFHFLYFLLFSFQHAFMVSFSMYSTILVSSNTRGREIPRDLQYGGFVINLAMKQHMPRLSLYFLFQECFSSTPSSFSSPLWT